MQTGVIIVLNKVNGSGAVSAHVLVPDYGDDVPLESLSHDSSSPSTRVSESRDLEPAVAVWVWPIAQRVVQVREGRITTRKPGLRWIGKGDSTPDMKTCQLRISRRSQSESECTRACRVSLEAHYIAILGRWSPALAFLFSSANHDRDIGH